MNGVIYAAAGIAGATGLGGLLGLLVNRLPEWVYARLCALAAGMMLYAAVIGLIAPAGSGLVVCVGVLLGAVFLDVVSERCERLVPGLDSNGGLLVLAIVLHHLPEGMAAGVSFGTGDAANITAVCTGIALQNIPEAMMIPPAMARAGRGAVAWAILCSGGIEIAGLLLGYGCVQLAAGVLPLLLAFAGGTMLFVVLRSIVTEDAYGILLGFCGMLVFA